MHKTYLELGRTIVKGLNKTKKPADRKLAQKIGQRLKEAR